MSTIQAFQIRLTPCGTFFFGGERSLSGTGNDNYYVKSRHFPQQTSVLGLLRMQLLASAGLLAEPHTGKKIPDENAAQALIGNTGFQAGNTNSFGAIEGISPIMLAQGDALFAPMLFSANMNFAQKMNGRFVSALDEKHVKANNYLPSFQIDGTDFDPKKEPPEKLFGTHGNAPVQFSDVFEERVSVGITKNKKHFPFLYSNDKIKPSEEAEMEGFFKQVSYRLKKGWSFVFVAWLEQEAGAKLSEFSKSNPVVWFGGERSAFNCQVDKMEIVLDLAPGFPGSDNEMIKVVLLSDAWADPGSIYQHCLFAHTKAQEFRHLISSVSKTENYYQRGKNAADNTSLGRSDKHHLFQRGSVFHCESKAQADALSSLLSSPQDFRRIGYNAFVSVHSEVVPNYFNPVNQ